MRSLAPAADAGAASDRGPQVVVGIAAPSSEQLAVAPPADSGLSPVAAPVAEMPPPALEVVAEPSLELVRESERLELVREKNLEIVRESVELLRERLADDAASAPAPTADESSSAASPEPSPAPPHTTSIVTPDEISIPPVGDLLVEVEPVAERFFSEGDVAHLAGKDDDETWEEGPASKAEQKRAPHVVERRARLARYVTWAVAGAAVVCLAAIGRSALLPASVASAPRAAAVTALAAAPETAAAALPAETKPAEAKVEETKPAEAKAEEAKPTEAKPADTKPAEEATKPAEEAKPAAAPSDKTALEEKKAAQSALDRGKLAEAIEAGERSVALDPTDGEAWLLLGAAYQEKGNMADARRAYSSCLKEGKRGPLGECRAMLR